MSNIRFTNDVFQAIYLNQHDLMVITIEVANFCSDENVGRPRYLDEHSKQGEVVTFHVDQRTTREFYVISLKVNPLFYHKLIPLVEER